MFRALFSRESTTAMQHRNCGLRKRKSPKQAMPYRRNGVLDVAKKTVLVGASSGVFEAIWGMLSQEREQVTEQG